MKISELFENVKPAEHPLPKGYTPDVHEMTTRKSRTEYKSNQKR
jgi:hypothetical protein